MRVKGQEGADWGSAELVVGWHLVEIDKVEDFTNKNAKRSLTINFKVKEGESEGAFATLYCDWDKEFGEKKIATVLAAIGLEAAFEKAFPGDVSYFSPKVVAKLMEKMPGNQCKIYVDQSKSGYMNINKVVNAKADTDKLDRETNKGKADKGGTGAGSVPKVAPPEKVESAGDDW